MARTNLLTKSWVVLIVGAGTWSSYAALPAMNLVVGARIENGEAEARNWLSYGRTYGEQRFSPLTQINPDTAKDLGLAWFADLETNRGQEATPLIVDGVVYISTAWSLVKAYDGRTGKLLWSYDPAVPREVGIHACCDVVNRGVAAWNGKILVATLDGRLVALNASTGKPHWSIHTGEANQPYTITQAPRVIKGRVVIGSGVAEHGTRGYISAYDAESGRLDWRFYTVPGDPSKAFETEAMARAAKTWSGNWWKFGGGGAVWDSIAFDPKLNLLYFGTGSVDSNGRERVLGRGDNLYIASIIALNADTGTYVWHYQVTPGDAWGYDATQQLILAELDIQGVRREVLMQANKNGFFYVLDRKTGALISAKPIAPINWTAGIDAKTGRPTQGKDARFSVSGQPVAIMPDSVGAHSWTPMAYNPNTGLVYIPAVEIASRLLPVVKDPQYSPLGSKGGVGFTTTSEHQGFLLAWDPKAQREAWRVTYRDPWNGGILTTAGNIVAQGGASGTFNIYRADNGEKLWSMFVQSGVVGGPSTFEVDGEQYIAVLGGRSGVDAFGAGKEVADSVDLQHISRILVFKLGGTAALPSSP